MQKTYLIFFTFVAIFVWLVYAPSLQHIPRSDHLNYLADVADYKTLPELITKTFHLDQTRSFTKRSPYLFRPVLFIFLACERYFFGYQFELWQAMGILIHLFVLWYLYRLLYAIKPNYLAALFLAFFAFQFTNTEMVTWQHINAYMFAVIAMLIILHSIWNLLNQKSLTKQELQIIFTAQLVASFTFEIMNLFALWWILFILWAPIKVKEKQAFILHLFLPVVLYIMAYVLVVHPSLVKYQALWQGKDVTGTNIIRYSLTANLWWILSAFITSGPFYYIPHHRLVIYFNTDFIGTLNKLCPVFLSIIGFMFIFKFVKGAKNKSKMKTSSTMFRSLIIGMLLIFTFGIVMGRLIPRELRYVVNNFYYHYFYWCLLLILLYTYLKDSTQRLPFRILSKSILIILIFFNIYFTLIINYTRAHLFRESRWLVKRIERKLKAEKRDPNFKLDIDPYVLGNFEVPWAPITYGEGKVASANDPGKKYYTFMELLYHPYLRRADLSSQP